jgi:hypothetical protein
MILLPAGALRHEAPRVEARRGLLLHARERPFTPTLRFIEQPRPFVLAPRR